MCNRFNKGFVWSCVCCAGLPTHFLLSLLFLKRLSFFSLTLKPLHTSLSVAVSVSLSLSHSRLFSQQSKYKLRCGNSDPYFYPSLYHLVSHSSLLNLTAAPPLVSITLSPILIFLSNCFFFDCAALQRLG